MINTFYIYVNIMLLQNFVVEQNFINILIGTIRIIICEDSEGLKIKGNKLPSYVIVHFLEAKIPKNDNFL